MTTKPISKPLICDDCGADCTVHSPAGPATLATDGSLRCWACHQKFDKRRARLNAEAPAMYEALKIAANWCGKCREALEKSTASIEREVPSPTTPMANMLAASMADANRHDASMFRMVEDHARAILQRIEGAP